MEPNRPGGLLAAEPTQTGIQVTLVPADGATAPVTFDVAWDASAEEMEALLASEEVAAARGALATPERLAGLEALVGAVTGAGWIALTESGDVLAGPALPRIDPCGILFLRIIVAYREVVSACLSPPPGDAFACAVAVANAASPTAQYEAQCR